MGLEGSIQDFGLADIIQFIRQQTKSGILIIESENNGAKVFFDQGLIVSAVTPETEGVDWIAHRLFRKGILPDPQVKQISEKDRQPGRFELALQEAGLASQQDIAQTLEIQTREILYSLFRLKTGKYQFEPKVVEFNRDHIKPMEADFVLLEGMRQLDEWPMLEKKIPNRNIVFEKKPEMESKVCVSAENEEDFDIFGGTPTEKPSNDGAVKVSPEEMRVFEGVDGKRNVLDLIDFSQIGEFNTFQALAHLGSQGIIYQSGVAEITPAVKEERKPPRVSKRQITIPYVWDMVSIGILIVASTFLFPGIQKSFLKITPGMEIFKQESLDSNVREFRESVLIYYFMNSEFPENKEEAIKLTQAKSEGVRYQVNGEGFVIRIEN